MLDLPSSVGSQLSAEAEDGFRPEIGLLILGWAGRPLARPPRGWAGDGRTNERIEQTLRV
ncbi:hypothetical protein ACFFQF_10750 [Haladaptatus pallidirubidus]